jgi:hypothetical protein
MAAPTRQAPVSEGRSRYQVLVNTSVPQRDPVTGKPTGQTDLVPPGEIVELTEQEAHHLMDTGPRSGHRIPLIRPYNERNEPLKRVHPAHASGLQIGPSVDARPDPAGSSRIQVMQDAPATGGGEGPEGHEPQAGSERELPSDLIDALDIAPSR